MNFGKRLKEARNKIGFTQKQLAGKLGMAYQQIGQYESNTRNPKKETVAKIAAALNLGYSYTSDGEPYFYDFVDTVANQEHNEDKIFNFQQADDEARIITLFNKLNGEGKDKAVEQVKLLTKIPDYIK